MSRALVVIAALLFVLGCVARQETAERVTFHSEEFHFSFQHPSSWVVSEGYTFIHRAQGAVASLNNLGKKDFWITWQQTSPSSWGYNSEVVLRQLSPGAVYFEVGWLEGGPPLLPQDYGPEMEAADLYQVRQGAKWETWDSDQLQRYSLLFFKWGRRWNILAYLVEPVSEADREALERVFDSFRFDAIPAGDERWAILQARPHLPEWAQPDMFPFRPGSRIGHLSVDRGVEVLHQGYDVLVTFSHAWSEDPNVSCQPENCHRWLFRVTATGEVILVEETGPIPPGL